MAGEAELAHIAVHDYRRRSRPFLGPNRGCSMLKNVLFTTWLQKDAPPAELIMRVIVRINVEGNNSRISPGIHNKSVRIFYTLPKVSIAENTIPLINKRLFGMARELHMSECKRYRQCSKCFRGLAEFWIGACLTKLFNHSENRIQENSGARHYVLARLTSAGSINRPLEKKQ